MALIRAACNPERCPWDCILELKRKCLNEIQEADAASDDDSDATVKMPDTYLMQEDTIIQEADAASDDDGLPTVKMTDTDLMQEDTYLMEDNGDDSDDGLN
eukprot:scaffold59410_cov66-Attheya_sp.AAC.9